MLAKNIVPQDSSTRNSAPFRVETTRPTRSILTGYILPAGTPGHILELTKEYVVIDFGLSPVIRLPLDSALIRFVYGGTR